MTKKNTTVVIVGLGYVGLPLALLAKKKGYKVIGIVKNPKKAELINKGVVPFNDKELEKKLKQFPVSATTDFKTVSEADIVIICVPTPIDDKSFPNYEPLILTSLNVGKYLKKDSLVILESTVNPGATETVMIPILELTSHGTAGTDFQISHCPERINPGDPYWNVENIPRVVGSINKIGLNRAVDFYRSILKGEVKPMNSIKEAEAVKIVENCFRDINIAFVNELAMSFSKLGIDVQNVIEGASTKPFAFMKHLPGCGVGGHCIPVDPYYLIEYAGKKGFDHTFLALARKINNNMPRFTVDLLLSALEKNGIDKKTAKVAVLGLAYKADIDDTRESPSLDIVKHLTEEGIAYDIFDPFVPKRSTSKSLEKALQKKDAIIIATNHSEFLKLKPQTLVENKVRIVIDGRNCLEKDKFINAGISYYGIGR